MIIYDILTPDTAIIYQIQVHVLFKKIPENIVYKVA